MRILLVDDEKEFLTMLAYYFQHDPRFSKDQIVLAEHAAQARALLHEEGPVDLVIADYQMPGEDGLSLVSFVKRLFPKTHLIVLSSYETISEKAQGLCDIFWQKPLDMKALADYVYTIKSQASFAD